MRQFTKIFIVIVVLIGSFSIALPESCALTTGNVYYVDINDPQAQDATTHGSIGTPWKTIHYALDQLEAGDTLLIREGVYEQQSSIRAATSGTEQAPITLKAYSGETVVWNTDTGNAFHIIDARYWIIEGIIFEDRLILGNSSKEIAENIIIRDCIFRNSDVGGIRPYYARHILVEDCDFINLRSNRAGSDLNAISIDRWGDDITIRNCRFEDIGSDGIHLGTQDDQIYQIVIENNEFFISGQRSPVGENGIDIKGVQGPVTITGNTFHGFRKTVDGQDASGAIGEAIVIHASYIGGPAARNVIVEKNLFYDNEIHLAITHGSRDIVVKNNIFRDSHGPEGRGLVVGDVDSIQIIFNTFYNNATHIRDWSNSTCTLRNNVFVRGGFASSLQNSDGTSSWNADYNAWHNMADNVPETLSGANDIINLDLHLNNDLSPAPDSPLLDAGIESLGVTDDFAGNLRDDNPDLGAYEMTSFQFQTFLPLMQR